MKFSSVQESEIACVPLRAHWGEKPELVQAVVDTPLATLLHYCLKASINALATWKRLVDTVARAGAVRQI